MEILSLWIFILQTVYQCNASQVSATSMYLYRCKILFSHPELFTVLPCQQCICCLAFDPSCHVVGRWAGGQILCGICCWLFFSLQVFWSTAATECGTARWSWRPSSSKPRPAPTSALMSSWTIHSSTLRRGIRRRRVPTRAGLLLRRGATTTSSRRTRMQELTVVTSPAEGGGPITASVWATKRGRNGMLGKSN